MKVIPFGEKVRIQRRLKKWTQQKLADEVGVKVETINRLENLKTPHPQNDTVEGLARAFGIEPHLFVVGTDLQYGKHRTIITKALLEDSLKKLDLHAQTYLEALNNTRHLIHQAQINLRRPPEARLKKLRPPKATKSAFGEVVVERRRPMPAKLG